MHKTLTFHTDPGHGWLKVNISDLLTLGIYDCISPYSYIDHEEQAAYLEEDLDVSIFNKAAIEAEWGYDTIRKYDGDLIRDMHGWPAVNGWRERAYAFLGWNAA